MATTGTARRCQPRSRRRGRRDAGGAARRDAGHRQDSNDRPEPLAPGSTGDPCRSTTGTARHAWGGHLLPIPEPAASRSEHSGVGVRASYIGRDDPGPVPRGQAGQRLDEHLRAAPGNGHIAFRDNIGGESRVRLSARSGDKQAQPRPLRGRSEAEPRTSGSRSGEGGNHSGRGARHRRLRSSRPQTGVGPCGQLGAGVGAADHRPSVRSVGPGHATRRRERVHRRNRIADPRQRCARYSLCGASEARLPSRLRRGGQPPPWATPVLLLLMPVPWPALVVPDPAPPPPLPPAGAVLDGGVETTLGAGDEALTPAELTPASDALPPASLELLLATVAFAPLPLELEPLLGAPAAWAGWAGATVAGAGLAGAGAGWEPDGTVSCGTGPTGASPVTLSWIPCGPAVAAGAACVVVLLRVAAPATKAIANATVMRRPRTNSERGAPRTTRASRDGRACSPAARCPKIEPTSTVAPVASPWPCSHNTLSCTLSRIQELY